MSAETSWWENLCESGDEEDDEDYDPFKDVAQAEPLEDSDSDSFEGLRHLLFPKAKSSGRRARGGVAGEQGSGVSENSSPAVPPVQPHWHTRKQGKLPDDVWTQTDSLLEKAEMALDPLSPGAQSDTYQNEMLANCTNPEYLRLLAVARGEREPDDDDEEDADFVPEDEDGDFVPEDDNNDDETGATLSVSNEELSALIADNRSNRASAAAHTLPTTSPRNSPNRRARAGANDTDKGKEVANEEVRKPVRSRRGRRDKKKADSVVRVLPFSEVGGLLPSGCTAGFSPDQCVQLQVFPPSSGPPTRPAPSPSRSLWLYSHAQSLSLFFPPQTFTPSQASLMVFRGKCWSICN